MFAFTLLLHFFVLLVPPPQAAKAGGLAGATFALALMADGAAIAVAPVTLAHFFLSREGVARRNSLAAAFICFAVVVTPSRAPFSA